MEGYGWTHITHYTVAIRPYKFLYKPWFFVESRQIPPHYFFHPAVGVFLSRSSVEYIIKTVVISPTVFNSVEGYSTPEYRARQNGNNGSIY